VLRIRSTRSSISLSARSLVCLSSSYLTDCFCMLTDILPNSLSTRRSNDKLDLAQILTRFRDFTNQNSTNIIMSTLRLLPRLAAVKPSIQTSVCPRRVCSSSLGLHVRGTKPISRTVVRPFHNTASASISQATKDKVNERNELFKRNNDIEARVKKIISEQLGVKSEEVCGRTLYL